MTFLTFYLFFAVLTAVAASYFLNRISQRNLEILVACEGMPEVFSNKKALIVLFGIFWPLTGVALFASGQP